MLNRPTALLDTWQIAVHNGAYVGLSYLWRSMGNNNLENGATGVRRAYRRRGIAMALKIRNIRWAMERGYPRIKTWNAAHNRSMLGINEALGFLKQPAWIEYRKTFQEDA